MESTPMEWDTIILTDDQQKAFWNWVISLPVTDTPEGDFIDDTLELYKVWSPSMKDDWTKKADVRFSGAADEAQQIYEKLVKQFLALDHGGTPYHLCKSKTGKID